MGALFLVSAYLQLNDPDSWLWIFVYLFAALVSFWHHRVPRAILLGVVFLCLSMSIYLVFVTSEIEWDRVFASFNMQGEGVEEIREVGGLLIITIWFSILIYMSNRE